MAPKRRAKCLEDDPYSSPQPTTNTSSPTSTEPPETKRQRRSLATSYLLCASSSVWVSRYADDPGTGELGPSVWTSIDSLSPQRSLTIRERSATPPSLPLFADRVHSATSNATQSESTDRCSSLSEQPITGHAAQGIASFISEDGKPIPLSKDYLAAARPKKSHKTSDEVYDASFTARPPEPGGTASSTGEITYGSEYGEHDIDEAYRPEQHNPSLNDAPPAIFSESVAHQIPSRMTASDQVFATYKLIELVLLHGECGGGQGLIRAGGVSRAFRHVVKRSERVRRHAFAVVLS